MSRVRCSKCGQFRPQTREFFYADRQKASGLRPSCKVCDNARLHEYAVSEAGRASHRMASSKYKRTTRGQLSGWRYNLKRWYGITAEQYDALFAAQDGKCAICGQPEIRTWRGKPKWLCVDHSHTTGQIRALLCCGCNSLLGFARERLHILDAAKAYLRRYK